MTIALLTKSFSLRELLNEQASGRGVLRLVADASLASDRSLVRAGIRLFCPDGTTREAMDALRREVPKARVYTHASYLAPEDRQRAVASLGINLETRAPLLDLLRIIICEIYESDHPVYLIVDDDRIESLLALAPLLNDLFDTVCAKLQQTMEDAAVYLVPASTCVVNVPVREAAV